MTRDYKFHDIFSTLSLIFLEIENSSLGRLIIVVKVIIAFSHRICNPYNPLIV